MALRNNIDISERFIAVALRKSVMDAQRADPRCRSAPVDVLRLAVLML
jgi:hypothetical protein